LLVGRGGGDAAEVSVFEPVAAAFEGDGLSVVDEPVDHRGGNDLVDDQQRVAAGSGELGLQPAGVVGFGEPRD
jgi:hypothetical protein